MSPRENFYDAATSDPDSTPALVVDWPIPGTSPEPAVRIDGVEYDRSAINRLIRVLKRARDTVHGADD